MFCWVFERVDGLTARYHDSGGLVVFAECRQHANALLKEYAEEHDYWGESFINPKAVDFNEADEVCQVKVGEVQPQVFVMPDAGCC